MKKKVCSGLTYYYNHDEKMSGVVSTRVQMRDKVDAKLLEEAVNEALEYHKDYKVQPEVTDNVLYFVDNPNPFRVEEGPEKDICMIRDTQGYLFYIRVEERCIEFDFYHMIMDGIAYCTFFRTVLDLYFAKKCPDECDWKKCIEESTKNITTEASCQESLFMERIFKTAEHIRKTDAAKEETIENYYNMYDYDDEDKRLCVYLHTGKIQEYADKWKIQPYVLVNVLLGNVIGNKHVASYMPINMRHFLKLGDYSYECLAYLNVPHVKQENSFEEQCITYQNSLRHHLGYRKAFKILKEDADLIRILQKESMSVSRKKAIVQRVMKRTEMYRGTFCTSYMPFLKEDDIMCNYVMDFQACTPRSGMGIILEMAQVGATISLNIRYQAHVEDIIRKFVDELKKLDMYKDSVELEICNMHIALPE